MMHQELSAVNLSHFERTLKVAGVSIDFLFMQLIGLTVELWLSIDWKCFRIQYLDRVFYDAACPRSSTYWYGHT
jgi:hypothetical protein